MGTQTAPFDDRTVDIAQRALLATPMPDHSRPVGATLRWSAEAAEIIAHRVHAHDGALTSADTAQIGRIAFAGARGPDVPAHLWARYVDEATKAAVKAIGVHATEQAEREQVADTTDLLLCVERHLREMGGFMRLETPYAAGTIEYNAQVLERVRAALAGVVA